ncbi:MAG: Rieske 2Fe-2S domain-containing protein [Vicinamibacterales bacterium]|nr:Rieske 2Fe-2S domain-containing protein [Vicinamibacterales bacterium]
MSSAFNRRRFLDAILGAGFISTIAAVAYPVWRYLIPPVSGEPATQSVVAAQASQVKPNSGLVFKFGSKPGLLVRTPDGELQAFNAVCTHLDCTVQYKPDTSQIWCACHNGTYDLQGNVVSGPPPRPLERLVVNQRGDEVVVSRT